MNRGIIGYVGKDAAKAIMQAGAPWEEYTGAHTA